MSLIFSFTMGSTSNHSRGFPEDIRQADMSNIHNALLGGIIFNAAKGIVLSALE
jgi:glucose uptake protein